MGFLCHIPQSIGTTVAQGRSYSLQSSHSSGTARREEVFLGPANPEKKRCYILELTIRRCPIQPDNIVVVRKSSSRHLKANEVSGSEAKAGTDVLLLPDSSAIGCTY